MLFLGKYTIDESQKNYIYDTIGGGWGAWHSDTFSPQTKDIDILKLQINGNTYESRKDNARNLAIMYQLEWAWLPWSYGELAEITNYFYKVGKRYGLIKEFKDNGIC